MITREEKQLIRYAIRHRWLNAEEGEDILFLREKFGKKFSIEELLRKRQYLTDSEIRELIESSSVDFDRRRQKTGIFRLRALTQAPKPKKAKAVPVPAPETKTSKEAASFGPARARKRRALRRLDGASHQERQAVPEHRSPTPTDIQQPSNVSSPMPTEEEAFQSPERTVVDDSYLADLEKLRAEFVAEIRDDSSLKVPQKIPPSSSSVEYVLEPAESQPLPELSLSSPDVDDSFASYEDTAEKTIVGVPILGDELFPAESSVSLTVEPKERAVEERLFENETIALVPEEVQSLHGFRDAYDRQSSETSKSPVEETYSKNPVAPSTIAKPPPVAPSIRYDDDKETPAPYVSSPRVDVVREAPALHSKESLHEALRAAVRSPDELAEGDEFAGFTIVRCVARGEMSTVYLAQRKADSRPFAIRVLTRIAQANETYAMRFFEQSNKVRGLSVPNIVRVFYVGTHDSHYFSVAEYVDGWSLEEQLTSRGPLEVSEALRVASAVTETLQALAEKGFSHGDIKPSNILVSKEGKIFLKDIGLAKNLTSTDLQAVGVTHPVCGTAEYLAPELLDGQLPSFQSDGYALGMTLVKLLRGQTLFTGEHASEILRQSLQERRPLVSTVLSRGTADFHSLIDRLICFYPQRRFSRVKQLDAAIQALLRKEINQSRNKPATKVHSDDIATRRVRSEAALAGGAGIGVFFAFGFLLKFFVSEPSSQTALNSALTSTAVVSLLIAMSLFVGLSLIRRGQIALPSASTFFLRTKDASGAIGGACLTMSMFIAAPSVLRLLGGVLGILTWLTLVYGVAVRRDIARARFGGSSSRTLAILGDVRLRPWRRIHALMLCTVVSVSILNFAVARYFQSSIG
ncbi:MAG: serine/threonine-protein kinase [Myxococcota bacterium]|nr:serine/threonine-protein kinase [Myxococcota bacterium]